MSEPMYCVNHPRQETYLRCNKCGQRICMRCAVSTPVGYRCRSCINAQQQVFYADFRPLHYVIAALVALPLGLIAGWLVPNLGWYAIIMGPLAGIGISEVTRWAIRRRRGPYIWLVVCGCIALGVLPKLAVTILSFLSLGGSWASMLGGHVVRVGLEGLLWDIVYVVAAAGAAYAFLRPGRRV